MAGACDRESSEKAQPQPSAGTPVAGETPQGVIDRSHKGSAIPDFTLANPSGERLALSSLAGKPLLLNLWATWCGPCVAELPALGKLAVERVGELQVTIVSQDTQTAKVGPFLKAHGVPQLEPWIDPANDLSFHYGTGTLPTTVLYDRNGKEVWRYVGSHDWSSPDTASLLQEAM